jgi:hypothetical protein
MARKAEREPVFLLHTNTPHQLTVLRLEMDSLLLVSSFSLHHLPSPLELFLDSERQGDGSE